MKKRIYLDNAASTPCDARVLKAMEPYWNEQFGNAGSVHHEGVVGNMALEKARSRIARFIAAHDDEIIFTSGGTESNNLALFGLITVLEQKGIVRSDMHIITSTIEHPSALDVFKELERSGVNVSYIDVEENGLIDPEAVRATLTPKTVLVSLVYVNNEIGTIQPIPTISKILRNSRETINYKLKTINSKMALPFFHTDASQAPLYLNCSVDRLGVDMMTTDAQKIYGPKGVGFLYKKRDVPLVSIMKGGNQEHGLRPGTENIPLIVGFTEAFAIAVKERESESKRLIELRNYFIDEVLQKIPHAELNGDREKRSPNNINISIPGLDAEYFVLVMDSACIAIGTKSACLSGEEESSYVIVALGKSDAHAVGALRFTLGRDTTKKDLDYVIKVLVEKVTLHRK